MKPETLQRLRFSTAALIRSVIASPWFWERLPPSRSVSVRSARAKFQRAALRAQSDPLRFIEKHLGRDWLMPDPKLRDRAAIALSEILGAIARTVESSGSSKEFVANENTEHWLLAQLRDFFVSLAGRPGRPGLDKYRAAAGFRVQHPKATNHRLCLLFEPAYRSMSTPQQCLARDRMRVGISRILKVAAARTKTPQ